MARNIRNMGKGNANKESFPTDQRGMNDILSAASKEFAGKNENDLMNELMGQVMQGRQDGSFTPEALQQFIRSVSPMLNGQQKQKLNDIVRRIK